MRQMLAREVKWTVVSGQLLISGARGCVYPNVKNGIFRRLRMADLNERGSGKMRSARQIAFGLLRRPSNLFGKAFRLGLRLLPAGATKSLADSLLRGHFSAMERQREVNVRVLEPYLPGITTDAGDVLTRSICQRSPPWARIEPLSCPIPGMLTEREKLYYLYLTRYYSGSGAVVELGTFLGMSTWYLLQGLKRNPRFSTKLHCFDAFTWYESMTKWVRGTKVIPPDLGGNFMPLFLDFMEDTGLIGDINAKRVNFIPSRAEEGDVPAFEWTGGPIELLIVDAGRTLAINDGWWNSLVDHFIPGRTLIVMQDWQHFKAVPHVFWNQTKIFTDEKLADMDLIHEVSEAGVGTFLYKGPGGAWAAEF